MDEFDEVTARQEDETRIQAVIDKAVDDGASLRLAQHMEPEQVDAWVDRFWDGMRDELDVEDRLRAIEMLLRARITARANDVLGGLA